MPNNQDPFVEARIKFAYEDVVRKVGLENVESSLRLELDEYRDTLDAIYTFEILPALLFPSYADELRASWHARSAFLLYQWEAGNHAHRSFIEALCAYYNAAFTLLRSALELLIKGALWECLAHAQFRENCDVLERDRRGKRVKKWLNDMFQRAAYTEEELEANSAAIYDKMGPVVEDPEYRLAMRIVIGQLAAWGIFDPIGDWEESVYRRMYGRLSADVHAVPDRTDIGKRILSQEPVFEQRVLKSVLDDYMHWLRELMDLGVVVELNIVSDLIRKSWLVKENLRAKLHELENLGLKYSARSANSLLAGLDR